MRSTPPLWLCAHEAGHVVARMVLDELPPFPGPFIRSVSVITAGDTLGQAYMPRRVMTFALPAPEAAAGFVDYDRVVANQRQHALYDVVEHLAGYTAELCQRSGPFGPLFVMERVIADTLKGQCDDADDLRVVREIIDWLDVAAPAAEMKRLWHCAYALVSSEWPGLVRFARILQKRQFLNADDVEAAWKTSRSTAPVRARLEARLGEGMTGWRDQLVMATTRRAAA